MADSGRDLAAFLHELALASPGVERRVAEGGVEFVTGSRVFAAIDHQGTAAFRLPGDVGRAALRTPGVSASTRGPEWVVLAPDATDRYGQDRAAAWFEHARKLAAAEPAPH